MAREEGFEAFARRLKVRLEERCLQEEASVLAGRPTSFEAYREKVGRIKGLSEAVSLVEETLARWTEEENDNDG